MELIKTSVTDPPIDSQVKGKVVKKGGKRIGYNYIILRSLKESQKNDVVTCLYIKSLTNFGVCVIKEGTYGDTKDKQGRDIKDRLMWQKQVHETLKGKVKLPRLLGSFEENGNYYLVLQRIRGISLYKACRDAGNNLREGLITGNKLGMKFLDYMLQLIELLSTLHSHQIVHRDVTASNFMISPAGKVAVIDMELSYSLETNFPDPPFQLGTYGYMSPEQEVTAMPTIEQDVFSIGAILIQIWTGILPSKITDIPFAELSDKVRFLIPDKEFATIVLNCLNSEPLLRPKLRKVSEIIREYKNDRKNKIIRNTNSIKEFTREEILNTIQQTIKTLGSPLMTDDEKGWFSENSKNSQYADKRKINKGWFASFHKGACGVIYLLSKANLLGMDITSTKPSIEKGLKLIEIKYCNNLNETHPGLHFGGSGIAAILAESIRAKLLEPHDIYIEWMNRLLEKDNELLGFQYGIAGQGIANWLCYPFLDSKKAQERLGEYAGRILFGQEPDGSWIRSKSGKKKRTTRGFAHGVAGIIYFLLEYANFSKNALALKAAEKGLQWLIKKSIHVGNRVYWRSSNDKEISPWWCEGAAGIAMAFLKAYSILGVGKYKEFASMALYNHNAAVIDNNLSQCHGLSGLGEIYLEMYRVSQNEEWLNRSRWIVQVLMNLKRQHTCHGPYWLVQNEREPTADFMVGNSGVIHFLLRSCYPDKVGFPLLP
jgi:serine/threonine protein kinase